jgi:hypothetical protein
MFFSFNNLESYFFTPPFGKSGRNCCSNIAQEEEREVQNEEKYTRNLVGCKIQGENLSPILGSHYKFISNTDARISTGMQGKRLESERV